MIAIVCMSYLRFFDLSSFLDSLRLFLIYDHECAMFASGSEKKDEVWKYVSMNGCMHGYGLKAEDAVCMHVV